MTTRVIDWPPPPPASPHETQTSVTAWADSEFGPCQPARAAERAAEEMVEFLDVLRARGSVRDLTPEDLTAMLREAADITCALYRFASTLGADLSDEVTRKMVVNRARRWRPDGTGCGYHVREEQACDLRDVIRSEDEVRAQVCASTHVPMDVLVGSEPCGFGHPPVTAQETREAAGAFMKDVRR